MAGIIARLYCNTEYGETIHVALRAVNNANCQGVYWGPKHWILLQFCRVTRVALIGMIEDKLYSTIIKQICIFKVTDAWGISGNHLCMKP